MAASSNSGKRNTSGKGRSTGNASGRIAGTRSAGSRNAGNKSTAGSSKRNTASSKNAQTSRKRDTSVMDEEVYRLPPERVREIYLFIYFAINLVLILGTYGVCGKLGRAVSGFFFGLFGATFYVLPVFFCVAACLIMANIDKPGSLRRAIIKVCWWFVVFMVAGFILQLSAGLKDHTAKTLYMDGYENLHGGGMFFGGIIVFVSKGIGKAGAIIVTILVAIITIIMITEKSIINLLKRAFTITYSDIVSERKKSGHTSRYDDDDDEEDDFDEYDYSGDDGQGRFSFDDIKVYPSEEEEKPKKKRKRNKVVKEEEMKELTKDEVPDDTPIALPGEKSAVQKGIEKALAQDEGPKDFFDIEPSQETYADPFGSDTYYDSRNSSVGKLPTKEETKSVNKTRTATDRLYSESGRLEDTGSIRGVREALGDEEVLKPTTSMDYFDMLDEDVPTASQMVSKPQAEEAKVTKDDKLRATDEVKSEIEKKTIEKPKKKYVFPPMKLLKSGGTSAYYKNDKNVRETAKRLKETLASFGVNVTITDYSCGPAVTRYELQPEQGVKVSRIVNLADDIKLNLAAADIRIEAPIPGKAAIGIEVPNTDNQVVYFRDLIDNDSFKKFKSNVAFAVGKDIGGQIIITDIAKMPHLLIAGATGSGKSVCINTIIMSILYKAAPEDVRMIMIDPKMVELSAYNGIPHLLIPVVTDPKKAAGALNWAVEEMTKRYQLFARYSVRNIQGFNQKVEQEKESGIENEDPSFVHMPQIIVIVDELADLMMVAHGEVEDSIVRLSQLARAAGIHLIIATQRPSVDVITGLIKANIPSRIAFAVSSGTDSRTILDMVGAEKLLGKGDMLFYPTGSTKPSRVQGAFISDEEVTAVTNYIKEHFGDSEYDTSISESINSSSSSVSSGGSSDDGSDADRYDELFEDAGRMVIEKEKASIGYLQRMFRIGFNRAARIMDQLCEAGVVGPEEGTKPRKILMTMDEFEEMMSL